MRDAEALELYVICRCWSYWRNWKCRWSRMSNARSRRRYHWHWQNVLEMKIPLCQQISGGVRLVDLLRNLHCPVVYMVPWTHISLCTNPKWTLNHLSSFLHGSCMPNTDRQKHKHTGHTMRDMCSIDFCAVRTFSKLIDGDRVYTI